MTFHSLNILKPSVAGPPGPPGEWTLSWIQNVTPTNAVQYSRSPLWCSDPYPCWICFPLSARWRFFFCVTVGLPGADGLPGLPGHNGTDGIPGLSGLPGADGKRGKKGEEQVTHYSLFHSPSTCINATGDAGHLSEEPLAQCNSERVETKNHQNTART